MAKGFANQGADLVLMARRLERLEELKVELEKLGIRCLPVKRDVTNPMEVKAAAEKAKEVFRKVDVLVNCAGSAKNNGVLNMTDEEWKFTMDTDLNSVFYVTREFANKFIENNLAYDMNNYVYLDFNFYD